MKTIQILTSLALTVLMLDAGAAVAQVRVQTSLQQDWSHLSQVISQQMGSRAQQSPPIAETTTEAVDITQLFKAGNRAQEFGDYVEAEAIWRTLLERAPNHAEAYSNLGDALSSQGQLAAAADAYRQSIQLNPNLAAAYTGLGFALLGQGQFEEAHENFALAAEINHRQAETHDNLGRILQSQGRLEEAIREYQLAIQLDPTYMPAQEHLNQAEQQMRWQ